LPSAAPLAPFAGAGGIAAAVTRALAAGAAAAGAGAGGALGSTSTFADGAMRLATAAGAIAAIVLHRARAIHAHRELRHQDDADHQRDGADGDPIASFTGCVSMLSSIGIVVMVLAGHIFLARIANYS
jgi:hypothetical protein